MNQCTNIIFGTDKCGVVLNGRNAANTSNNITGGQAQLGDWPWQVNMAYKYGYSRKCGGTIVDKDIILTDADCFGNDLILHNVGTGTSYKDFNNREVPRWKYKVKRVITHGGFKKYNIKHNIALIFLNESIEFNEFVQPACVERVKGETFPVNTTCYIAAWAGQKPPLYWQEKKVKIISKKDCGPFSHLKDYHMCTFKPNKVCYGPEGVPLVCKKNGKYYVAGIMASSATEGDGICSEYAVFSDVNYYLDWIKNRVVRHQSGELSDMSVCGTNLLTTVPALRRVFKGKISKEGTWPWSVFIKLGYREFTGVLITSDTVLTTAYFAEEFKEGTKSTVYVGFTDLTKSKGIKAKIKGVTVHEDFSSYRYFGNDIAIVTLDQDIPYSDASRPVCLEDREETENADQTVTEECYFSGWGSDVKGRKDPDFLREKKVKILDFQTCKKKFKRFTDKLFCTDATKGGPCWSDFGGGVVCKKYGRFYLVGISMVMPGSTCGEGYGLFTNVTRYIPWLKEKLL